jgi:hypothetical protein
VKCADSLMGGMQFLPCSISDAIYPALPRQAVCQCTTDNCATKAWTALPPPSIAISVEHSDLLVGVHEVYKGLAMVSVGWLGCVLLGLNSAVSVPHAASECLFTFCYSHCISSASYVFASSWVLHTNWTCISIVQNTSHCCKIVSHTLQYLHVV